jgi:hypothetical protein
MLMLAGKVHDLSDFGFGDFVGVHAANANAMLVDVEHDPGGVLLILAEKPLQHVDHELHGRVVIIEQQDLVQRRFIRLVFGLGPTQSPGGTR